MTPSLEQTIISSAPSFYCVSESAPNTFEELKEQCTTETISVYSGGCSKTIYSTPEVNLAFRAWHDYVHLNSNLNFSKESEIEVAKIQCAQCTNEEDKRLLWADIAGQVWYYYKFSTFVFDQKAFVLNFIKYFNYGELPE